MTRRPKKRACCAAGGRIVAMTQHYMAPKRTKRPASRLVAGLLWLVAAGTAVAATFANIVIYVFSGGESIFVVGFWRQYGLTVAGENSPGSIYYGAAEVSAAALLLLATLLAFLSARRWAAIAAGAFGTGMLVTSTLTWFLTALSGQAGNTTTIEPGLWTLTGATGVALVAFLVALTERGRPESRSSQEFYDAPTPPTGLPMAPQAQQHVRWEPETPKYGIPVQQEQPPDVQRVEAGSAVAEEPTERTENPDRTERTRPAEPAESAETVRAEPARAEPARTAVSHEEDVFVEAFDLPEFTANGSRPGQTTRKLDGDEK
jgi:hypothetical protein